MLAELEPPSLSASDDAVSLEKVDRMWAIVHPPVAAHVTLVGHHTLPLLLALLRRDCAAVCSARPGAPSPDGETADVVWIVDARGEGELDEGLRIARVRTDDRTRVVIEANGVPGSLGLAAIHEHAARFGFGVLFTDWEERRLVLAATPRLGAGRMNTGRLPARAPQPG